MKHAVIALSALVMLVTLPARAFAQPQHTDSPKATVIVTQTLLVGPAILLPGEYKVQCRMFEGKTFLVITSADKGKEIVRVPCEREILSSKVTETQLRVTTIGDGSQTLQSVRIKGELVAHRVIAG